MKDDPFMKLLMIEIEPVDALEFINRMGRRELQGRYKNKEEKPKMAGSETFNKLVTVSPHGFQGVRKEPSRLVQCLSGYRTSKSHQVYCQGRATGRRDD
ncbi:MAG: hypothetical protein LBG57_08680 [Treponema sp.]|jgi:hypothetical protein|nr:hypothetical protein [Treponema sp.]